MTMATTASHDNNDERNAPSKHVPPVSSSKSDAENNEKTESTNKKTVFLVLAAVIVTVAIVAVVVAVLTGGNNKSNSSGSNSHVAVPIYTETVRLSNPEPLYDQCDVDLSGRNSCASKGPRFGFGVALLTSDTEDNLVVGAPQDDSPDSPDEIDEAGSVSIFARDSGSKGEWTLQNKVFGSTGESDMGEAVAVTKVEGDVHALLGRPDANDDFVFPVQQSTGWYLNLVPPLQPVGDLFSGPATFGSAIATDGSWAVVGAEYEYVKDFNSYGLGDSQGAVYLYNYTTSGGWTRLYHQIGFVERARFGSAVAIRHGLVVVGAPGEDDNTGAIYVYQFSMDHDGNADDWNLHASIRPPAEEDAFWFGTSVAIVDPNTIVACATSTDQNNDDTSKRFGACFVYETTEDGHKWELIQWGLVQKFTSQDGDEDDFGDSLAVSPDGKYLVVGGIQRSDTMAVAWLFERQEDGQFVKIARLECSDSDLDHRWSDTSVAISGSTVVVGAPHADDWHGAVCVYDLDDVINV